MNEEIVKASFIILKVFSSELIFSLLIDTLRFKDHQILW